MIGLGIATVLAGMVAGNLGAVLMKAFNIGLFWNSIAGGAGGLAIALIPVALGRDFIEPWYYDLLAAGAAGAAVMLVSGGLVALRFRGL